MSDPHDKPSALDDMMMGLPAGFENTVAGKAIRGSRLFQELTAQLLEVWRMGPEWGEGYEKWKREVQCNPLLEPRDRTVLFDLGKQLLE